MYMHASPINAFLYTHNSILKYFYSGRVHVDVFEVVFKSLLAIIKSDMIPSYREPLVLAEWSHALDMPEVPKGFEIEPIELTLFNGQTSEPFPPKENAISECHDLF